MCSENGTGQGSSPAPFSASRRRGATRGWLLEIVSSIEAKFQIRRGTIAGCFAARPACPRKKAFGGRTRRRALFGVGRTMSLYGSWREQLRIISAPGVYSFLAAQHNGPPRVTLRRAIMF